VLQVFWNCSIRFKIILQQGNLQRLSKWNSRLNLPWTCAAYLRSVNAVTASVRCATGHFSMHTRDYAHGSNCIDRRWDIFVNISPPTSFRQRQQSFKIVQFYFRTDWEAWCTGNRWDFYSRSNRFESWSDCRLHGLCFVAFLSYVRRIKNTLSLATTGSYLILTYLPPLSTPSEGCLSDQY
jgi:hypothetical protein